MSYPFDLTVSYGEDNFVDVEGKKGRTYAHDIVRNLMADGLSDGSSLVSIEDYSDDITARMSARGGAEFFDGDTFLFRASSVSQLLVDDRVVTGAGHVHVCSNSKKIYKALSAAIDAKRFRFTGAFDCVNQHVLSDSTPTQGVLSADRPVPYYFHDESPLRGRVTFAEVLPNENGRRVAIVNVDSQEPALVHSISPGTVIYLGGNHKEFAFSLTTSSSTSCSGRNDNGLFFPVSTAPLELSPGSCDTRIVITSSPWERTYGGGHCGRNVALAKMKNGNFLFWGTDYSPSAGCQLSLLPFSEIPMEFFPEDSGWPTSVGMKCDTSVSAMFDGAWIMRGARLLESLDEKLYPDGVLERLRGGFDRISNITHSFSAFRIHSRVNKVLRLLEATKGKLEGFRSVDGGKYECTIESLSEVSRIPAAAIGAFISSYGLASNCFFDVAFSGRAMQGKLKLVGGIPTGEWMNGRLVPTSAGLLHCVINNTYHNVENRDGISFVRPYVGTGTTAAKTLTLAGRIQ